MRCSICRSPPAPISFANCAGLMPKARKPFNKAAPPLPPRMRLIRVVSQFMDSGFTVAFTELSPCAFCWLFAPAAASPSVRSSSCGQIIAGNSLPLQKAARAKASCSGPKAALSFTRIKPVLTITKPSSSARKTGRALSRFQSSRARNRRP